LKVQDAKPGFVFTAATELAFLRAAGRWAFPIHSTLAMTGLRIGELVHLPIKELDLEGGRFLVRDKTALRWRVKIGNARDVPLPPEVVADLSRVIGDRQSGPVLLRERFVYVSPPLAGDGERSERACLERRKAAGPALSRAKESRVALVLKQA